MSFQQQTLENKPLEDIKPYRWITLNEQKEFCDFLESLGIYFDKLKRWMDVFPKKQFLIMHSKDFFDNPSKIYQNTLDFLNMPQFDLKNYDVQGRVNENPNIDSKLRKQLIEYFKPHNERLYQFLGRNFDWDK